MLNIKALRPSDHYFPSDMMNLGRRLWRAYLHNHDKRWRTFIQNTESNTIFINIIINLFFIFIIIFRITNYKSTFRLGEVRVQAWCEKRMPSQREQYSSTVHLFIGKGRSPCRITFVPFTFINNSIVILRGLICLFIFKSVPLFCCHAEAFLRTASWLPCPSL